MSRPIQYDRRPSESPLRSRLFTKEPRKRLVPRELEVEANVDRGIRSLTTSHPTAARRIQFTPEQVPPTNQSESLVHAREEEEYARLRNVSRSPKRSLRKGLPLVFEQGARETLVMTRHDTGTEANHMSLELAESLGYEVDTENENKNQFELPNGKIIYSIGIVLARLRFAQGQDAETISMTCHFNVFSHLALPVLIGMAFLNATETLSKYTSRLASPPSDWKRSLRLYSIGSSPSRVECTLNGHRVTATADTGAEIALVNDKHAKAWNLIQGQSCEELELADGSRVFTDGFGDIHLTIQAGTQGNWVTKTVRFHVLENLRLNVILGEEIVEDFGIFRNGMSSVKAITAGVIPGLCPIFHLSTVEKVMLSATDKLKEKLSSKLPWKHEAYSKLIISI
jgi:hypothetical protein